MIVALCFIFLIIIRMVSLIDLKNSKQLVCFYFIWKFRNKKLIMFWIISNIGCDFNQINKMLKERLMFESEIAFALLLNLRLFGFYFEFCMSRTCKISSCSIMQHNSRFIFKTNLELFRCKIRFIVNQETKWSKVCSILR